MVGQQNTSRHFMGSDEDVTVGGQTTKLDVGVGDRGSRICSLIGGSWSAIPS